MNRRRGAMMVATGMSSVDGGEVMAAVQAGPALRLLREAKVSALLAPVAPELDRFEASGVTVQDGVLWIIFDNLPHVAAVHPDLRPGPAAVQLIWQAGPAPGYEDIARDDATGQHFILIESAPSPNGGFMPQIDDFDPSWHDRRRRPVDLSLESPNKGLEGLTCVHREGQRFLLAISEGNGNHAGRRGERPGDGLIHVLSERDDHWMVVAQIRLPSDLPFRDYSALSVRGDHIAVASQEDSAVWVGGMDPQSWRIDDAGVVHPFPRDAGGRIIYGNVEGVCWIDDWTLAVVSDRAKRSQPQRMRATSESIHIFELP